MKTIMITVAFVAATLGANAQSEFGDSNDYAEEEQEFYDNTTGSFDTKLEKYSDHQILWMMRYTLKNLVDCNNPFVATYRQAFIKGKLRDRHYLITMLNTLHNLFPDEVNKAKMKIDTEFF